MKIRNPKSSTRPCILDLLPKNPGLPVAVMSQHWFPAGNASPSNCFECSSERGLPVATSVLDPSREACVPNRSPLSVAAFSPSSSLGLVRTHAPTVPSEHERYRLQRKLLVMVDRSQNPYSSIPHDTPGSEAIHLGCIYPHPCAQELAEGQLLVSPISCWLYPCWLE